MKGRRLIQLNITLFSLLAIIMAAISGCAVTTKAKKSKAASGLEQRLKQYAHAMSVNDFNFTYSLESKATRESVPFDEYLSEKHSTNAENEVYKISRVQYDKVRDYYIVNVKVVLVNIPNVAKLTISDMRGEIWKYENGDFYRVGPAKKMRFLTEKKEDEPPKDQQEETEDEEKSSNKKKRKNELINVVSN